MTKTENAKYDFDQALEMLKINKRSLSRATGRIRELGGINRVRGRKAMGIEG